MSSSIYALRESPIHRLNPLTKLVATLALIVVAFAISLWWFPLALLALVIVPVALLAKLGRRLLVLSVALLLPLLIVLILVQGFIYPGATTVLIDFGPVQYSLDGFLVALAIGARTSVFVTACLLLLSTTHPGTLMTALTEKGMPPRFSYVISATLQVLPAFQERSASILLAQRARGLRVRGGPVKRIRVLMPLVRPLVLSMFVDLEERSTAIDARAFGSVRKRTVLIPVPDSTPQRLARWGIVVLAAAGVALGVLVVSR
jgi:energy-coupling factor transport system permease protein